MFQAQGHAVDATCSIICSSVSIDGIDTRNHVRRIDFDGLFLYISRLASNTEFFPLPIKIMLDILYIITIIFAVISALCVLLLSGVHDRRYQTGFAVVAGASFAIAFGCGIAGMITEIP